MPARSKVLPRRPVSGAKARSVSPPATPKKHEQPRGSGRRGGRPPSPTSLYAARTRKEFALAETRELELAKRRGELVEADATRREWENITRLIRARVSAIPSRVRQLLPHLTAHDVEIITAEVRATLTTLADNAPDDRPA